MEVPSDDGLFSFDIVVDLKTKDKNGQEGPVRRVAIEVDGPFHFISNRGGHEYHGRAKIRNRCGGLFASPRGSASF